jgi:hypothetical protein
LLGKIMDSEGKLRLLLITTRRLEYTPPWTERGVVIKLLLEPLPISDIRSLIRERLGVEALPEPLARQVAEKAEGNPLFAEEIVSFLSERGIVRTTVGKLDFDGTVPIESKFFMMPLRGWGIVRPDRVTAIFLCVDARCDPGHWLARMSVLCRPHSAV